MKFSPIEIALDQYTGYGFVAATIFGPNGSFDAELLLDTGASMTTLSSNLANHLGYDLKELRMETRSRPSQCESPLPARGAS